MMMVVVMGAFYRKSNVFGRYLLHGGANSRNFVVAIVSSHIARMLGDNRGKYGLYLMEVVEVKHVPNRHETPLLRILDPLQRADR